MKFFKLLFSFVSIAFFVSGCTQLPKYELSPEARLADAVWMTSIFESNYAPLQYKETLHGFSYADKKHEFLQNALKEQSNTEYYALLNQFVAQFQDAHTGLQLPWPSAKGAGEIATLGFVGSRSGENILVRFVFPGLYGTRGFPVKEGDLIEKINGLDPREYCEQTQGHTSNIGSSEANFTVRASAALMPVSMADAMPAEKDIQLRIKRGDKSFDVTLPWIRMDFVDFMNLQSQMYYSASASQRAKFRELGTLIEFYRAWNQGNRESAMTYIQKFIPNSGKFKFWNTFEALNFRSPSAMAAAVKRLDRAQKGQGDSPEWARYIRNIPKDVMWVPDSYLYPTYISSESSTTEDKTTSRLIATMVLDSFSMPEDWALEEAAATLAYLKKMGVHDLIIDTIDNGGGSLSLGVKLAQLFRSEKIALPMIQMRTSESWIQEFEYASNNALTIAERELSRRVYDELVAARGAGQILSKKYSIESLMPYEIEPNANADSSLRVVLLVNEMCASMCDIFAGMMKDNQIATLVGQQTMGAGGNVVMHMASANTGMMLRQTESLILRSNGEFIENNGVKPDVEMVVSEMAKDLYQGVRQKAVEILLK